MLEQIFSLNWVQKRSHAFLLGLFYGIIGMISAVAIFPQDAGLMSVAFTSALLIPVLNSLLVKEESIEIKQNRFSLKRIVLDHANIFKVYIYMFFGILLAYSASTMILRQEVIEMMFGPQLSSIGFTGGAVYDLSFESLVRNNLVVFALCFILSFVYGAGSIIFLTWNASVWGVVVTWVAKQAAMGSSSAMITGFFAIITPLLPHMITEAAAYIWAAIVGGVVSRAVVREDSNSKGFYYVLTDAVVLLAWGVILVLVAGFIEAAFF